MLFVHRMRTAKNPAIELTITAMLHKTDDIPWTPEELDPVKAGPDFRRDIFRFRIRGGDHVSRWHDSPESISRILMDLRTADMVGGVSEVVPGTAPETKRD